MSKILLKFTETIEKRFVIQKMRCILPLDMTLLLTDRTNAEEFLQ